MIYQHAVVLMLSWSVALFLPVLSYADEPAIPKEQTIVVSGETLTAALSKQPGSIKVTSSTDEQPIIISLPGGDTVTEFAVSSWYSDAGATLVVETTDSNGDLRDYYWITLWMATKDNPWKERQKKTGRNIGIKAIGSIMLRTDDLELGDLSGPGDEVNATLFDPKAIDGTDRHLVYFFRHACATIGDFPGELRRHYVASKAVEAIRTRRNSKQQ